MSLDSDALRIAAAGIRGVAPAAAVRRTLSRTGRTIRVGSHALTIGSAGRIHLLAVGKAAGAMIDAAATVLGTDHEGLAITPRGYPGPRRGLPVVFGDHPVPGRGSFRAGRALLAYVRATAPTDGVIFLISGGGSAVVESPTASLQASDIVETTQLLLASGAPIGTMNTIRRHLSAIKGGQLALATSARSIATIALSDVVGDPPADIASGPTVGDPSTFEDALQGVRRYRMASQLPRRALRHLTEGCAGRIPETPKPGDPRLRGAHFVLGATNRRALEGAARAAHGLGYRSRVLSTTVTGETQPVARRFATTLVRTSARAPGRKVAILSGGETTVTLGPNPGKGGRNQEFALAAAPILDGATALVLSIGTDGVDGPTDAAGGWVDGATANSALRRHIDLAAALRRHAAYEPLARLGSLVRTGPTGTNVMDLHVGLALTPGRPGTAGNSRPSAAPSNRRRRS